MAQIIFFPSITNKVIFAPKMAKKCYRFEWRLVFKAATQFNFGTRSQNLNGTILFEDWKFYYLNRYCEKY